MAATATTSTVTAASTVMAASTVTAASWPDALIIAKQLAHTADPNTQILLLNNGRKVSLLYVACTDGNSALVALLIERGADVNARSLGGTPLYAVASSLCVDIVRLLLTAGANPNITCKWGWSPIRMINDIEVARVLVQAADVEENSELEQRGFETLLETCAREGQAEKLELLLEFGVDPNAHPNGPTPLHWAFRERNFESVEVLLAAGANPRIRDNDGRLPFEWLSGRLFGAGLCPTNDHEAAPLDRETWMRYAALSQPLAKNAVDA